MGPPAVGKAFSLFCQVAQSPLKAGVYTCHKGSNLTLIHPDSFFPVRHTQNHVFYSSKLDGFDDSPMERAYMTHVYLSRQALFFLLKIVLLSIFINPKLQICFFSFPRSWGTRVNSNSLYARLARQYCPSTWNLSFSESIPLGF